MSENIICYDGFFKDTSPTELHFSEATSGLARQEVCRVCSIQTFSALFTRAPFAVWSILKVRTLKF
jgi:hypothetical protein